MIDLDSIIESGTHVECIDQFIVNNYVPLLECTSNILLQQSNNAKEFILDSTYPLGYNSEYIEDKDLSLSTFGNISDQLRTDLIYFDHTSRLIFLILNRKKYLFKII